MTELKRDVEHGYVTGSGWEPSFWERGNVRYCLMSYSLWGRNIMIDLGIMKKKVKKK